MSFGASYQHEYIMKYLTLPCNSPACNGSERRFQFWLIMKNKGEIYFCTECVSPPTQGDMGPSIGPFQEGAGGILVDSKHPGIVLVPF